MLPRRVFSLSLAPCVTMFYFRCVPVCFVPNALKCFIPRLGHDGDTTVAEQLYKSTVRQYYKRVQCRLFFRGGHAFGLGFHID